MLVQTNFLSSGYDLTIYLLKPLFSDKVTLLVWKPLGKSKFCGRKMKIKEKIKQKRLSYRLRLLLDLVAVDRCKMEFVEGRKKLPHLCSSNKTLDRP